jgi:hypothetical protein
VRYFYLLIAGAIMVSSCSQNPGAMPSPGSSFSTLSGSAPKITKVSSIKPKQYQKIVISGSGFGTMKPYDGDSEYLQIWDTTGHWSAGYTSSTQIDSVWLDVTSWSDSKIDIKGFTGDYGESYWVLKKGDDLTINVWNAQTRDGPATLYTKVK